MFSICMKFCATSSKAVSNSNHSVTMISKSIGKILLLAVCLVTAWMLLLIGLRYPDNHGAGVMMFRSLFLGILIASGVCMITRNGFVLAALILAAIGFASTWIVDQRNIMVDYDIWLKRGMPTWGQLTGNDVSL